MSSAVLTKIARRKLDQWAQQAYPNEYYQSERIRQSAMNVTECPADWKMVSNPPGNKEENSVKDYYSKYNKVYVRGNKFCAPNNDNQTKLEGRKKITPKKVMRDIGELLPETRGIREQRREALTSAKQQREKIQNEYKNAEKQKQLEKDKKKLEKIFKKLYKNDDDREIKSKVTTYLQQVTSCADETKCNEDSCIEIRPASGDFGATCAPKNMEDFFGEDKKTNKQSVRELSSWWETYYNKHQELKTAEDLKAKAKYSLLTKHLHPGQRLPSQPRYVQVPA